MKKVIGLLSLLLCLAFSQAQTISVLNRNEVFKSPEDGIVVMDKYTFGKYHYTAEKYDTLKVEIQKLDSVIQCKDSAQAKVVSGFESVLKNKEEQIDAYEKGFGDLQSTLITAIAKESQLKVDYFLLEQKNKRIKKWRNIFVGTSALLGAIIVLSVTH